MKTPSHTFEKLAETIRDTRNGQKYRALPATKQLMKNMLGVVEGIGEVAAKDKRVTKAAAAKSRGVKAEAGSVKRAV